MSYDADALRAFFNAYGEREWDRLENTPAADALIELETAMYDQPGLVDAGGHLLGVARRR